MWWDEFDSIFWISLATLLAGASGVAVRYCLKSKCEHFSCCFGAVSIDRRVDLEVEEHLRELEMGIKDDEAQTSAK